MNSIRDNSLLAASRAWYSAPIAQFLGHDPQVIIGELTRNAEFPVELDQRDAWMTQIDVLRNSLSELAGSVYLEFSIPRMGKRIDAVVICDSVIYVIEFKVGASRLDRAAINQAWDYALDLKNFHEASHNAPVMPILVATNGRFPIPETAPIDSDGVFEPVGTDPRGLRAAMALAANSASGMAIESAAWHSAPYRPTPTIVEAARSLYSQHAVEAIHSFDAGKQNLAITSARLEELVNEARANHRKVICFVTGVPGAGKTLVGLNVATQHRAESGSDPAVFLSGNGPLVAVLREALTRDEYERRRQAGQAARKGKIGESVKAFIQNVHHFRDDNLQHGGSPAEHVAIFDEAQRAWNLPKTADFMHRRKRIPNFPMSEPEFLISCMDRHKDWAVIVCLVGGGQEINTGEAGIDAWLDAVDASFPHWQVHISANLRDSEYAAGKAVQRALDCGNAVLEDSLHLAVSMRSFRAENVSGFVKALLDHNLDAARSLLAQLDRNYPIRLTRDLDAAKEWVRSKARGTERYGLICSSKAMRLKPHAIDIRHSVNPVHWFLNDAEDTRSSQFLEDAATEFQVQGLEVDWACVNWDADLRFTGSGWSHHDFRGSRWVNIHKHETQRYLLNAYRVLLTRARQGMVLFVPPGKTDDPTRNPAWYDGTYEYLSSVGIQELA
jgi:hypothetical protein